MPRSTVLIIEDESDIANLVKFHLEKAGHTAIVAATGRMGLESIARQRPDLIILDIMLPDLDGLEVCRKIKRDAATSAIPVLMVSARGEENDIVAGLELGAEDYVTKPFSPRVLLARVRAIIRRNEAEDSREVVFGEALRIDPARHQVLIRGEPLDLTLTQYRLLHFLAMRPGFVRTRDQIVTAVRGEGTVLSSRAIDVHIAALRQKLGECGDLIETVRGVGYRLTTESVGSAV